MTLHVQTQAVPGGSYTDIDMEALGFAQIKLLVSYRSPARLTFILYKPQHEMPLGIDRFLRFWDDAATDPFGSAFSSSNPIFEGFITDCSPGEESNVVTVTCHDPTHKASTSIPVMSTAWISGTPPDEGIGAVPRFIANCPLRGDTDFLYNQDSGLTVGNLCARLLDDALELLRYYNGAPPASTAYDAGDLNVLAYVPQGKVTFDNSSLRSALDSILKWYPSRKLIWYPGSRRWRYLDLLNGITKSITLNDFTGDYNVLEFELHRSIQERYTAVKIYGPETVVQTTFTTASGSLTEIPSGVVLETYTDNTGMHDVEAVTAWQITDPAQRRIAKWLTTKLETDLQSGGSVQTVVPLLEVSYDNGSTWYGIPWQYIDFETGTVYCYGLYPHNTYPSAPNPPSTQTIFVPNAVRFTACSFADPLSVRVPTSGYQGTAYSVGGITLEYRIYDEMLAVGYDPFGIPVTTVDRLAAYEVIATTLLQERQDIVYGGGVVLEGLEFDFLRLNIRMNIAADDGSGNAITTGWESIGAFVTDVEYNWSEQTTTVQFSSDQLELIGISSDILRARLGVNVSLKRKQRLDTRPIFRTYLPKFGGHQVTEQAGVEYTLSSYYIDPNNPNAKPQTGIQGHHAAFREDPGSVGGNPLYDEAMEREEQDVGMEDVNL